MKKTNRSACDEKLILALAAGANMREAARRAGVSESTAYRRRRDADFRQAVGEAQDRALEPARGQLAGLASMAVETLERLLQSDKPSEALRAAKVVLELGPRLRAAAKLEERINRVEDQLFDEQTAEDETPLGEEELIQALAAGEALPEPTVPEPTLPETAERAGPGEQAEQPTAERLSDAGFQRRVSRARGWLLVSAVGGLACLASKATAIFGRLMQSDEPSVARRAAKAVLELGPRLRESTELEERVSLLEEAEENTEPTCVVIDDNPWYGEG